MRYSNLSCKGRSRYSWIKFAAAGAFAIALAGCGGSSGSSAPAAGGGTGTGGGTTAGPTAPTGVVTAAAADPAGTNTAQNPNQAFGLIATGGGTPVSIQSPPVVNFTVIDASGKFVSGLTLIKEAGKADAACTSSTTSTSGNLRFTIAKLVQPATGPSTWQNLISRQRYATSTTNKNSVAEGTYDPLPSTTVTNPDTALTDPSTRIVGILEENTDGGYYTYHFATDVVTPLLFADAVDGATSQSGKVANNGNVAVKDGTTIHRVGLQLCYTDPSSGAKVIANPLIDFTLDADGIGTPVKDSNGVIALSKKVVDKDSCNECHGELKMHGTRVDPNYCVTCHNPGSTDFDSNNPIDLKVMVHKLHMGKGLTKDYRVREVIAKDTATGEGIAYPQPQQNCTKCHDNTKAAQADNWMSVPSRDACGACHDGIDFATGTGTTMTNKPAGSTVNTNGHAGGAQTDDAACSICHKAATVVIQHTGTLTAAEDITQRTMSAAISGVAISSSDGSVTVTFSLTDNGVAVTDPAALKEMYFTLAKLVKASPTTNVSTNWVSYTGRARTKDAAQPPVIQGYSEFWSDGTLTHTGGGVWTYKFGLKTATPAGDIRAVDHVNNVSTVTGAYNKATVPTYANVVAYEPSLTHRVGIEFKTAAGVENTTNAFFDFVPDGSTTAETRNIVTMSTCATCHGGRKIHKGFATEYCVTCHNRNTYEPYSGNSPVTVDLQRVVHKVHYNGTDYVINHEEFGSGPTGASGYPNDIKKCEVCHKETATKADGTTVLENAANWRTSPTPEACGSCHESTAATDHMASQVAAGAQCAFCHNPDSAYGLDVKSVHSK